MASTKTTNSKNITTVCAILLLVGCLVFALSDYIVWYGDAILYQFNYATGERLGSITDIFSSQYAHYFIHNGRTVAHVLVQLFVGFIGRTGFALCNALVYIVFILLIMRLAGLSVRKPAHVLASSLLVLFFVDTSYIPPHQIGYVWMGTLNLSFLLAYRKTESSVEIKPAMCCLLVLLGLSAGNGNETFSIGIGAALFIHFMLRLRENNLYSWLLIASYGAGALTLCLAPSMSQHASETYHVPLWMSVYNLVIYLRATYVFALLLAIALIRRKTTIGRFYRDNAVLINAMIILLVFDFLITIKGNRQLFGIELCACIMSLRLCRLFKARVWMFVGAVIAVTAIYAYKFKVLSMANADERELRAQIASTTDGNIYIDLTNHAVGVQPIEELSYHDCVNLNFHIGAWADDIDNHGPFYLLDRYEGNRDHLSRYHLYPTAFKDAAEGEVKDRVIECGNGVYLLMKARGGDSRFILHRELDVPGISIPMSDYEIPFDNVYGLDTERYQVLVTTFPVPLMRAVSVEIVDK